MIERRWLKKRLGVEGEPVLKDKGWARITYVNDELGRSIERAHFGVRGEPVIGRNDRYHRGKRVLDERSNMLSSLYLEQTGNRFRLRPQTANPTARDSSRGSMRRTMRRAPTASMKSESGTP